MNLSVIFNSIIPDNIKNIPLVQKCTEIIIEQLNRNSTIAQRISNLYTIDRVSFLKTDKFGSITEISDSDFLTETKNNLKDALFNVYVCVLYNLAQKIQSNPDIVEVTNKRNYSETLITKDIYDILTSEYLGAFRYFQQNSGTKKAIKYIYQFAKYLETGYIYDDLDIEENGCFTTLYSGSLHKSYFSEFNQPMSHPCGWCYEYTTVINELFIDYFGIEFIKTPKRIVLKNNSNIVVFTTMSVNEFYENLENANNVLSDEAYTQEEIDNIKNIRIIRTSDIETLNGLENCIVLFNVNFVKLVDSVVHFENTILDYTNGIYYGDKQYINDYDRLNKLQGYYIQTGEIKETFEFTYHDEMSFEYEVSFDDTSYYKDDISKAFKLYNGVYPFTQGVDETRYNVDIYDKNNFKSFNLHVNVHSDTLTHITICDDYGHQYITNLNNAIVNTHGWYGENLNIYCRHSELDFYIKSNILNKINNTITISEFKVANNKLIVKGHSDSAGVYTLGQTSDTFNSDINLELNIPNVNEIQLVLTNNDCSITIKTNIHKYTLFNFDFPYYIENINYPSSITLISTNMNNYPTSGKKLSQLTKYNLVNKGYTKVTVNANDCYVVDSTQFVDDDFDCDEILSGKFLTFTNSKSEGNYTDGKFLTVYENSLEREKNRGLFGRILTFC